MSLLKGRWVLVGTAASAAVIVPYMLLGRAEVPVQLPPPPIPTAFAADAPGALSYALIAPPFDPDRSPGPPAGTEAPAGAEAAPPPPPPPPVLVGLITGGGKRVALAKGSDGETRTLRAGEAVAGWRLVSIGRDQALFEQAGIRHSAKLDFSNKAGAIATAPPPPPASPPPTALAAQQHGKK